MAQVVENTLWKTGTDLSCIFNIIPDVATQDAMALACSHATDLVSWDVLQRCHNGRDGVPNHQPHDCLLIRLFRRRSKKTSKLRAIGLCAGNSPVTGDTRFPKLPGNKVCNPVAHGAAKSGRIAREGLNILYVVLGVHKCNFGSCLIHTLLSDPCMRVSQFIRLIDSSI